MLGTVLRILCVLILLSQGPMTQVIVLHPFSGKKIEAKND